MAPLSTHFSTFSSNHAPVNKKVGETYQGIERAEELEGGEPYPFVLYDFNVKQNSSI